MVSAGHVASVAVAAVATVLLDPSTEAGACAKLLNRANQATGKVAQPLIDAAEPLVGQAFELAGPYLVGASHLFYNVLFLLALVHLLEAFRRTGVKGLAGTVVRGIRLLPGVNELILFVLKGEISSSLKELTNDTSAGSGSSSTEQPIIPIPEKGLGREETLRIMDAEQKGDGDHCHEGRAFAFSYFNDAGRFEGHTTFLSNVYARFAEKAGLPDSPKNGKLLDELSQAVFHRYAHGNALNPLMFPTLRKYETEVLSMAANMLHGDQNVVGALTSGGTESILMTVSQPLCAPRRHMTTQYLIVALAAPLLVRLMASRVILCFGFFCRSRPTASAPVRCFRTLPSLRSCAQSRFTLPLKRPATTSMSRLCTPLSTLKRSK